GGVAVDGELVALGLTVGVVESREDSCARAVLSPLVGPGDDEAAAVQGEDPGAGLRAGRVVGDLQFAAHGRPGGVVDLSLDTVTVVVHAHPGRDEAAAFQVRKPDVVLRADRGGVETE